MNNETICQIVSFKVKLQYMINETAKLSCLINEIAKLTRNDFLRTKITVTSQTVVGMKTEIYAYASSIVKTEKMTNFR